jgi:cyclopropane-fatty-acyl-phospholipid synthase
VKSRLYIANVMHARFSPVKHRFRYPVFTFAFDLDELPALDRSVRGFGYNRRALVSLRDRDYLRGEGTIRERLMRFLREAGCDDGVARVELLTMPRMFGHVFNPVSFHYCYRADGSVRCVVAEVNNTFGERHLYILREPESDPARFPLRFRHEKQFHVSPFNDMRGHYEFSLSELGPSMRLTVDLVRDGDKVMTAALWGDAVALDSRTLLGHVLRHPFRIVSNLPRIAWQAALLHYRRKLPIHRKPNPSHPMTIAIPPPTTYERWCMGVVRRLLSGLSDGRLVVELPDGTAWTFGDAAAPASTMRVWSYRFFKRFVLGGDVGFGESYTDGEWTTDDLPGLLTLLVRNLEALGAAAVNPGLAARFANCILHACRRNTARGSRRNIRAHYDLGNDFYQLWLDPETMLYSCAVFERPGQTLADAQRAKILRIIELAGIGPDHHVLEIGCGWGGFAIEAVRRTGCRVTGITISEAQLRLAQERVRAAGLADRIELRLMDYRDLEGQYDRIVSIEMLEAVGHEFFGVFFRKCADVLKPGGQIALQVITIPDGRYDAYRRSPDWIQKHIFPGGLLPSRSILDAAMASAGLRVERADNIGSHYPATLRAWRERFNASAEDLGRMGFDAAFQRQWNYYFAYCEAGFSTGYIDDWQLAVGEALTDRE